MTDIDFYQWDGELSGPPLKDCLRLCDFLPAEMQEEFREINASLAPMLSYTWSREEHYEQAVRWVKALVLARERKDSTRKFLKGSLKGIYDLDRTLRAADEFQTEPVLKKDIPERITRQGGAVGEDDPMRLSAVLSGVDYVLREKTFEYDLATPSDAVDAVAHLLNVEPPDRFWLAEYVAVRHRYPHWDPIIYAVYGDWQVEIARWE